MDPKNTESSVEARRVSEAEARRWRVEMDGGATASAIATREGYDARTVRVHVKRVRRAEGTSSQRADLLRNALVAHQDDLTELAKVLADHFRQGTRPSAVRSPQGLPASALADHLGRTPSGKALRDWMALVADYAELRVPLTERLEGDEGLAAFAAKGFSQRTLAGQIVSVAEGQPESSMSRVASGVPTADALNAEWAVLRRSLMGWDEFKKAQDCCDRARQLGRQLVDRLDVLRLRRYIPGSCRYCPDAEGE
jgi:hypothetical protein